MVNSANQLYVPYYIDPSCEKEEEGEKTQLGCTSQNIFLPDCQTGNRTGQQPEPDQETRGPGDI